jgi:hypothetical protein
VTFIFYVRIIILFVLREAEYRYKLTNVKKCTTYWSTQFPNAFFNLSALIIPDFFTFDIHCHIAREQRHNVEVYPNCRLTNYVFK